MRGAILALLMSVFVSIPAHAKDPDAVAPVAPDATSVGTITLKGGRVAAGIGYTWGHGELQYQNKIHRFTIKGLSIVDIGASEYTAWGEVFDLEKLGDFAGNYVAIAAGVAVAGGATATYLRNEHGVVIKLIETDIGLQFNLAAEGVRIALKN